jgi:hypothetical protein
METEALAAQEPGRREENARKAMEFAGKEFSGERWIFGIRQITPLPNKK